MSVLHCVCYWVYVYLFVGFLVTSLLVVGDPAPFIFHIHPRLYCRDARDRMLSRDTFLARYLEAHGKTCPRQPSYFTSRRTTTTAFSLVELEFGDTPYL